jgi:hypothetical protein
MGAAYNRELCSIGAFRFAEWNHDDPFYLLWVAGGRDYVGAAARYAVYAELDTFWRATQGRLAIAHGACSGADTLASQRAKRGGAAELAIPAHWGALGRKVAGPMRNRWVATIAKPHGVACVPRGKRNARRYAQGIAARDTMLRAGGRCSIACGVSGAHGARLSPTLVGGGALPRGMAQSECRRRPPPHFLYGHRQCREPMPPNPNTR